MARVAGQGFQTGAKNDVQDIDLCVARRQQGVDVGHREMTAGFVNAGDENVLRLKFWARNLRAITHGGNDVCRNLLHLRKCRAGSQPLGAAVQAIVGYQ